MKQTAVEWLVEQFYLDYNGENELSPSEFIDRAKEMERQQLNIARIDGINLDNKGYGRKGSDEIEKSEKPINLTEISNDEIREQAIKYDNQATYDTPIVHFMEGAFWYKELLKSKQNDKH